MLTKPHAAKPTGAAKRITSLGVQIGLIGGAALLYFAVRGQTEGNEALAVAHGLDVLRFEQLLGLDVETRLQDLVLPHRWAVTAMNWVYIWGHWPVISVTLVWLYRTRRDSYLLLRNALFVSGAIGLVIFVIYPVAPPRLLPGGFVDTVTEFSTSYRVLQPPSLVNKYAALPSLHVGWNLLAGIAIFRSRANRFTRVFGVVSPVAMVAAVVLTGNHYIVDAALGAVVALAGLAVATWLAERPVDRDLDLVPAYRSEPTPTRQGPIAGPVCTGTGALDDLVIDDIRPLVGASDRPRCP